MGHAMGDEVGDYGGSQDRGDSRGVDVDLADSDEQYPMGEEAGR